MEFLLLFAFAMLFAIAFNYAQPKALGRFPKFASSFWGVTLVTAVAVLVLLVVVSFVFAEVGEAVVEVTT
jgi:predicted PurR-regulated permease PerM